MVLPPRSSLVVSACLALVMACLALDALPFLALGLNALWPLVSALAGGAHAPAGGAVRPGPEVACLTAARPSLPAVHRALGCPDAIAETAAHAR